MTKESVFDAPPPAFFDRQSTLALPPSERFDQWRAWHPTVELNPLTKSAARGLEAQVLRYRLPDGTVFGFTRSGEVESRFGRLSSANYFLFSAVMSGGAISSAGKHELPMRPGNRLYLIDGRRPLRTRGSADLSHVYLVLPREPAIEAITRDPLSGPHAVLGVESRGLLAIAFAQLQALLHHLKDLSEPAVAEVIRSAAGLVTFGLKQQFGGTSDVDRPVAYEMVYLSARRMMETYSGNPQLTASSIAIAIGCSRAHLYRAFATQGLTVADVLREIRLKKAQSLLQDRRPRSLGQIAAQSGFADQSSFSRAFRAAFGITPRQWRELARESSSA